MASFLLYSLIDKYVKIFLKQKEAIESRRYLNTDRNNVGYYDKKIQDPSSSYDQQSTERCKEAQGQAAQEVKAMRCHCALSYLVALRDRGHRWLFG